MVRVEDLNGGADEPGRAGVGIPEGPVFPGEVSAAGDGQVGECLDCVVDPKVGVAVPGRDGEAETVGGQHADDGGEGLVGGTVGVPVAGWRW